MANATAQAALAGLRRQAAKNPLRRLIKQGNIWPNRWRRTQSETLRAKDLMPKHGFALRFRERRPRRAGRRIYRNLQRSILCYRVDS